MQHPGCTLPGVRQVSILVNPEITSKCFNIHNVDFGWTVHALTCLVYYSGNVGACSNGKINAATNDGGKVLLDQGLFLI